MRQVKFRYWNGSKVLNQEAIINHLNKYIARNDKHLMQFTGLFDKQGVEIYEGDVVSFMFLKTKVESKRGVVVFDVDELCYFIRTSSEWGYNHNLAWCDTEVMGNIHENKDLLQDVEG